MQNILIPYNVTDTHCLLVDVTLVLRETGCDEVLFFDSVTSGLYPETRHQTFLSNLNTFLDMVIEEIPDWKGTRVGLHRGCSLR